MTQSCTNTLEQSVSRGEGTLRQNSISNHNGNMLLSSPDESLPLSGTNKEDLLVPDSCMMVGESSSEGEEEDEEEDLDDEEGIIRNDVLSDHEQRQQPSDMNGHEHGTLEATTDWMTTNEIGSGLPTPMATSKVRFYYL